jgi:peptidoglycan/xylan/chitin deacetylase (PgdA/CDA1 family)
MLELVFNIQLKCWLQKGKKIFAMKKVVIFAFLLLEAISFGQVKQVCFSYDDLPVVSYGISDTGYQKYLMDKLILSLRRNKIPAIGFVNEGKLFGDKGVNQFQVELLKSWVSAGLDLGNHTYSHPDYNSASFNDFTRDVLKGETISKEIAKSMGKSIRYFRHPFLHVGTTKAKADSLESFLRVNGYLPAPVTIDNDDYLFALAYKRAIANEDSSLSLKIGHDYIIYMENKLRFYEKQAKILFGRDINQILLLHASKLNSDYVDSLAVMFRNNHYIFVSMDEALKDKAYQSEITCFGNWGISWIDKWALSQGKKGVFFKDEPVTPDYIRKLSE